MKPEDRKRLKQHIEMIVEHKEPDVIAQENFKKLQDEVADLREKNIKLRLDLHTLRFKEAEEQRFIWWIWNVYARNVNDLILSIISATTYDNETMAKLGKYGLPRKCFEFLERVKEGTDRIYDGTYLDVEISADVKKGIPENKPEPSNSDVSMTQDVLTDIKTGQSVKNTNPDYYKDAEKTAFVRLCGALGVLTENNDLSTTALLAATRIERLEKKIPALNVDLAEASMYAYNGEIARMKLEADLARRDEIIRRLKEDADRLAAQLEDPLFCEASNDLVLCEHYDLMKEQEADDD